MIRESIQKLVNRSNLTYKEASTIMTEIMSGKATDSQTAAFLTALRMKGEVAEELIAFAFVMRNHCTQIHPHVKGRLIDTCGTGGDKVKTFNVSTAAAFIIAGADIAVAKHGNRAVTSKSGSADALEKLGLTLNREPKAVEENIQKLGIGFMFAPAFHPAMKYAAEPRREIGVRTVFNILGPLTNPARANAQLLGVYDPKIVEPIAFALEKLGCEEAMVVHGLNGLDEISTVGKTVIAHLKQGKIKKSEINPRDFGVKKASIEKLKCTSVEDSSETLFKILNGTILGDPKSDIALVNSAAGIIIGGKADTFQEAMELALESVKSGAAYGKLKGLIKASDGSLVHLEELETKYD